MSLALRMTEIAEIVLKKNEDRRIRAGHLWVFSNEVDVNATPLNQFQCGQWVRIRSQSGKVLGCGYVNPTSLICARLVSHHANGHLDSALIYKRMRCALQLREKIYSSPFYRLIFSESDGLPGLIIDRYGEVFVIQINTAGMESVRDEIVTCVSEMFSPKAILLRNDSSQRLLEGLECYVQSVGREHPKEIEILENRARFLAPFEDGQKTGWFYDHRENRQVLSRFSGQLRVLDVFSYIGGWGVQAAMAGAKAVTCVDASANALAYLRQNAARNGVAERVRTMHGDAFTALRQLRDEKQKFDIVVLDPPAFIKRKKDLKKGREAYRRVNQLAMQVMADDGMLVSASCSYHLSRAALQSVLLHCTTELKRTGMILAHGYQAYDHPIHPAIGETEYLKAIFMRVLKD